MPSTRQIRQRIKVAKNTQQITKAMKMVAAARLKRAQDRVQAARPYSEKMREVMGSLAGSAGAAVDHPLLQVRDVERVGIFVFTSDRGLCGGYNASVLRRTVELVNELGRDRCVLYVVGRKGNQFLRRRNYNVVQSLSVNSNDLKFSDALDVAALARKEFESGAVDEVYLVYSKFISAITQVPRSLRLLPIETPESTGPAAEYIYEPEPAGLLAELLPRYVVNQVYQSLMESIASEHGARMTSMSSATDNAGKMISSLTLVLNRARQANITKEISEIVGGAEALKG
jgi:F-type H+-transporting ATPase subunit gamma